MQQSDPEGDTLAIAGKVTAEEASGSNRDTVDLNLEVGLASDVGPRRKLNEDCADYHLPADKARHQAKGGIFVVADGMGGHQAGDVASRRAVSLVIDGYVADEAPLPSDSLVRAIKAANRILYEEALSDPAKSGMGTTLVAAIVLANKVYVANVGDSRAYIVDEQGMTQITEDHSWVEEQVRAGLLAPEQAATHPQRNLITRALGSKSSVNVDLFEGELHEGQTLLLCTDGLSNPLSDQQMAQIILAVLPGEAAQQLVQQAAELGGDDNATALVVQATGSRIETAQDRVETTVTSRPSGEGNSEVSRQTQPRGQIRLPLRERRWQALVVVVTAALVLALCGLVGWPGGLGALLGSERDGVPQIGPIVDPRLAGSSLERVAVYLGYAGSNEILAAHSGPLDAATLGTAPLWPRERWLLLVGPARDDRCAGRVCGFQVQIGDWTYRVTYQPVPDDQPRAGSHRVRVFGLVQGDCAEETACTEIVANRIERQRSLLAWWKPRWQGIFRAGAADGQVWVYGLAATGTSGLIAPDEGSDLEAGARILARGTWLEAERSMAFHAAEVYVLERDRYVPVSSQISPALLPTVTLEPTQVTSP
jgi:serine/threonine protein phosphatase PrpC